MTLHLLSFLLAVKAMNHDFVPASESADVKADAYVARSLLSYAYKNKKTEPYPILKRDILKVQSLITHDRIRRGSKGACENRYAYVYETERDFIYLCPAYHRARESERINTLIHEAYHLVGYDEPRAHKFERGIKYLLDTATLKE